MLLIPRRIILIVSSVFLLLFIAISLATAIEARGPTPQIIQVHHAQAARVGDVDDVFAAKALLNGTDHDRSDGYNGSSGVSGATLVPTTKTETRDSFTPKPQTSANWNDEGVLGPLATPTPSAVPASRPPTTPQIPIVALTYSGAGGTKHCRGKVLQKTYFPPPLETWKKGTCITLPSEARCGVFYSNQGDNCEAQLFNMPNCYNTTGSYVNTVIFMPEERAVGALWSSMWVQCGVDVPEAKMLDPSILGGALKKPGSG